jgi:hypothetical protein
LRQFGIGPGSGGGVTNDIVKRISITYPTAACAFETAGLCLVALDSSGSTKSQLRSQKLDWTRVECGLTCYSTVQPLKYLPVEAI